MTAANNNRILRIIYEFCRYTTLGNRKPAAATQNKYSESREQRQIENTVFRFGFVGTHLILSKYRDKNPKYGKQGKIIGQRQERGRCGRTAGTQQKRHGIRTSRPSVLFREHTYRHRPKRNQRNHHAEDDHEIDAVHHERPECRAHPSVTV